MAADEDLIPPSLKSKPRFEVHMSENLNRDGDAEQQLNSHQEEMSDLVNLLRLLRQEV